MSITYDEIANPQMYPESTIERAIRKAIGAEDADHRFRLEAMAYIGETGVEIVIEATAKNFTQEQRQNVATLSLTRRDLDIMRRVLETLAEEEDDG